MTKEILIYDRLCIDIYTIGYTPEGESIVFVIWSGNEILYTGVIDSYEKNNINQTKKLLDMLDIKKINMLCWSHPDNDHSKGFYKLFDFLDENSVFVIPSNIVEYKNKIENQFSEIWDFINNEQLYPRIQKSKGYTPVKCRIQYVAENTIIYNLPCTYFVKDATKYEFTIKSFLPISQNTFQGEFNRRNMEVNGFSVGLQLQLGEFCAIFASDCHNDYIKKIDKGNFSQYCDFLKVPHHGSKTSTKILDYFDNAIKKGYKIEASSVTKKTVKLPNADALKLYQNVSDNILYTNEVDRGFDYGISIFSADVTDVDIEYSYRFKGNANFKI